MKKLLLTVFSVILISFATPASANQLLTNGNFENGFPGGWTLTGPAWQSVGAPDAHEGAASAKNTIVDLGIDHFANFSQTLALGDNTDVWATVFAKSQINPQAFARVILQVDFLNNANLVLGTKKTETGGMTNWKQLYLTAKSPVGTTKVRYNLIVFAPASEVSDPNGLAFGGSGLFDLAVLSTDPIAPPLPQTALNNTGFENGFVDWQLFPPGLSVDNQAFYQGVLSAKSEVGTIPGNDWFSGAYQDLVYQGGPVFASARFKTNLTGNAIAGIKLEFYNAAGSQLFPFSQQTLQGVNNWKRLVINGSGSGVTPPAGTAIIRVLVFTYTAQGDTAAIGGVANFDDVVFSYSPLPPEFSTDITNGGFENSFNGWTNLFGVPAELSTSAHSGSFAAKKNIQFFSGQDYFSQLYWDVYADAAGTTYPTGTFVNASAYVLSSYSPVTKNKGGLQMEFINNLGNVIGQSITHLDGGQSGYGYRQVQGATPAGTKRVRVSLVDFSREQDSTIPGFILGDDVVFSYNQLPKVALPNALVNPGFENGINGDGTHEGWVEENKPGEVEANPTFVHSGNYSARYQVDAQTNPSGSNYFGSAHQDVSVNPGQKVTASVWAKIIANVATPTAATMTLAFYDNNDQQIGPSYADAIFGNTDWTQLKIANKTAPAGTKYARITCSLFADKNNAQIGNRAWFDDGVVIVRSFTAVRLGPHVPARPCPITGPCP